MSTEQETTEIIPIPLRWHASPLQVTPLPPPAFFKASVTVCHHPFLLVGRMMVSLYCSNCHYHHDNHQNKLSLVQISAEDNYQ